MRHILFLALALAIPFLPPLQAATESELTTKEILEQLRGLPQKFGRDSPYYDYHGNADERLQMLMIRRFSVTGDICRELDSVSFESYPAYGASLFDVLATVKDPASIPQLDAWLKGPKRKQVYDLWIKGWHQYLRGAAPSELMWLTGTNEWSTFFRGWAASEKSQTDRIRVLQIMQGWLHDSATQTFFTELEHDAKATDEEILLAQLYLRQHSKSYDRAKLSLTISSLRKSSDGTRILLRYAGSIRDEAFVPTLIEIADQKIEEEFITPQRALEAITLQRGIADSAGWKAWYGINGQKGRTVWMEEAGSRLTSMATTNVTEVDAILSKAVYNWDDLAMLSCMERLATYKQLQSEVVGWINLTYAEVPFLRNKLQPLASKIKDTGYDKLTKWAKNLMEGWDFFEPDKTTWQEYVRLSNTRV